jgi:hypothetical protein
MHKNRVKTMAGWMLFGMMTVAAVALFGTAWAADAKAAKKHLQEMLHHANEMVSHGKAGHIDVLAEHANAVIRHGQEALEVLPKDNPHAQEAATHTQSAVEEAEQAEDHGSSGHGDIAMKHAEAALQHVQEAEKHAKGL